MLKSVDINNDMLTFPIETLSDGGIELFFFNLLRMSQRKDHGNPN